MARLRRSVAQTFGGLAPRRRSRRGRRALQRVVIPPSALYLCDRRGILGEMEYNIVCEEGVRRWVREEVVVGYGVFDPEWVNYRMYVDEWVDSGRRISFLIWARQQGYQLPEENQM